LSSAGLGQHRLDHAGDELLLRLRQLCHRFDLLLPLRSGPALAASASRGHGLGSEKSPSDAASVVATVGSASRRGPVIGRRHGVVGIGIGIGTGLGPEPLVTLPGEGAPPALGATARFPFQPGLCLQSR